MSFIIERCKNLGKGRRRKGVSVPQAVPPPETKEPQRPVAVSTAQQIPKASSGHADHVRVPQAPPVADVGVHPAAVDPRDKEPQPVTGSGAQQDLNLSQKLWNDAYDNLKRDEDKLVEAYRNTLVKVLVHEKLKSKKVADTSAAGAREDLKAEILDELKDPKAQKATDASTARARDVLAEREDLKTQILDELEDRTKRQMHMKMLVENGKAKAAKAPKITKAVDDFAQAILSIKPIIDPQAVPAALPWAGVCFGLQASNNPFITWFPCQLTPVRYYRILRKRRNLTLRVSLMLLLECTFIAL